MNKTKKDFIGRGSNMTRKGIHINITILIFAILIICSFSIVYFLNIKTNTLFQEKGKILPINIVEVNGKNRGLKYQFPRPGNSPYFTSIGYVKGEEIRELGSDVKKLVIYRLSGNWYKLYFNNHLIGTMGDIEDNRSDVWNNLGVYTITEKLIKDNNELRIESYNEYEFGRLGYPPTITTNKQAINIQNWVYMVLFGVNLVVMGVLIITFIILAILSMFVDYRVKRIDYSYILFAFCVLIMAFTILDHVQMNVLPISLLNYKKFITSGYYIGPILLSAALIMKFKSKSLTVMSVLLFVSWLYLMIMTKDVISLKKSYDITNYLILITMGLWFRITLKNFKESFYAKILFGGSFTHLIFAGHDIINFALGNYFNNFYTYGLFIFAVSIIGVVITDIIKVMGNLEFEQKRSEILYQRSIRDGMTNTYNHQHIHKILSETQKDYTLIIIDIDDFKDINDNYGHLAGDAVIKRVAKICKENIRDIDVVGRYGGDEFLIILFDTSREIVQSSAKRLKNKIEEVFEFEGSSIKTSVSMGIFSSKKGFDYERILSMADKGLYDAKKQGKSRIAEYNAGEIDD